MKFWLFLIWVTMLSMKDGSTTGHAEIKEECRMKKNEENDPNFYYFYFNIEHWYDFNRQTGMGENLFKD